MVKKTTMTADMRPNTSSPGRPDQPAPLFIGAEGIDATQPDEKDDGEEDEAQYEVGDVAAAEQAVDGNVRAVNAQEDCEVASTKM